MSVAILDRMRQAVNDHRMGALELAMAEWALRHDGDTAVAVAMATATRAIHEGHSCVPLEHTEFAIPGESPIADSQAVQVALKQSDLVGSPGDSRPLIVDDNLLYLHRYWQYEYRLATSLNALLAQPGEAIDTQALLPGNGLFSDQDLAEDDCHWQAVAAAVALRHRLAVISGGPGTGKTYTVLRLMRLLVEAASKSSQPAPLIRLAAPTGKAAARMVESIQNGLGDMVLPAAVTAHLPGEAQTLHRLIGLGFGSTLPRHNADNPLLADVVIVDEASMVDLPLMAKLIAALPKHARLILLGDRYQLASVESGSVMAELCDAAGVNRFSQEQQQALAPLLDNAEPVQDAARIDDHVVTLMVSHRFGSDGEIGRLAASVNAGNADRVISHLDPKSNNGQTLWRTQSDSATLQLIAESAAEHFRQLVDASEAGQALESLSRRGLLCALRVGPCGSQAMNQRITELLAERVGFDPRRRWFHGRPIIVLANDYRAGLFNGDTGVCLADEDGHPRVWFRTDAGLRSFLPSALPDHDSAFAMTVHKSQGSEFDHVSLLLPPEDNAVLSRELIYTGLTRAKKSIDVTASAEVLKAAIQRRTVRHSGLRARLA